MVKNSYIDLEFINLISSIIEILLQAQSEENENLVKQKIAIQGKIANIKGNIDSIKIQNGENYEFNNINLQINEINKSISSALKEFKEEDLKTSYSILRKKKDDLEISVYSNLSMLILNKIEVSPQTVEKTIRTYSDLLQKMVNFNPKEIDVQIYKKILHNLDNLNLFTNQENNLSLAQERNPINDHKSKIHLMAILKWIKGIAKLGILNHQKEQMNSGNNNELVKNLENELQDLINKENEINSNNQTEMEIEKVRGIIDDLSMIGERSQQIVKQAQEYIKRICDNPKRKIESVLKEENFTISELYSQFQKMSNGNKSASHIKESNPKKHMTHLICPSNLCGMLKCLKQN